MRRVDASFEIRARGDRPRSRESLDRVTQDKALVFCILFVSFEWAYNLMFSVRPNKVASMSMDVLH